MKINVNPRLLKYLVLGAGGLGLVLRILLYTTGTDEKGLLIPGHWAGVCIWLLTAAVAAAIFFFTRALEGPKEYRDCCPVSIPAGLGAFAAALGILAASISEMGSAAVPVQRVTFIFGFLTAAALVVTGLCRLTGAKAHFLLHASVSVYFALRMVSQYQRWSADPQLMDYCFYLTACVALMLTGYHQAAFAAELGKHRSLWRLSLTAVYLCCLSMVGSRDTLLMLTCGIWAFTNLTSLNPRPRRQRPALILEVETMERQP